MEEIQFKTEFIEKELPVILVEISGYIDQANCDQLQHIFDELYESNHFNIILDFAGLSYMSSAGWGILVGDVKRFKDKSGNIKVCNMRPEVFEVFQMLEFYHILDEYYSVDEALSAFTGKKQIKKTSRKKKVIEEESIEDLLEGTYKDTVDAEVVEENNNKTVSLELDENDLHMPADEKTEMSPELDTDTDESDMNEQINQGSEFKVDMKNLPLQEKIKKIVAMFPLISIRHMKKMLRHEDFGSMRIGTFKLYRLLRKLNLENKIKRYRYYRSC